MAITYANSRIEVTPYVSGTPTSATSTTLVDTTKTWVASAQVGRIVWIKTGTGAGQTRYITASTTNSLTVTPAWAVTPDATSTYVISHNHQDIVTATPTYASQTNNNVTATFTAPIFLRSGGFLACVGRQWRFTNAQQFVGGEVGCLFQMGAKLNNKSVSASQYPSLLHALYSQAPYWYPQVSCKYIIYGSQITITRTQADTANSLAYFLPTATDDGWEIYNSIISGAWVVLSTGKDKVINSVFVARPNTVVDVDTNIGLNSSSVVTGYTGSMSLRNEDGCKGVDVIDFNSVTPAANDFYLYLYNLPNAVTYLWNPTLTSSTWTGLARWAANTGDGHIYRGYLVGISIIDSAGSAVNDVTVGVFNTATKAGGILTSKSSYLPVVSQAVTVNGTYTGMVGTGEGLPVLYARYTRTSEYVSAELLYGPYTFTVRKYGYQFVSLPRNWVERSKEQLTLVSNAYVVATQAVAAAYTGIAIDPVADTITISSNRTIQEVYDYSQNWAASINNAIYIEPVRTDDGITFTIPTDSLIVSAGGLISGKLVVPAGVTVNGAIANNTTITGNVVKNTPTDMTNVTIVGNLTFNTNTNTTITLTNCLIGTITNSGTGLVTINMVNSSATAGTLVTLRSVITFTNDAGLNFSNQVWVFDSLGNLVGDTGFASLASSVTAYMPLGGSLRLYAQAYGTKPKILNITSVAANQTFSLVPETFVDTTLNVTTRNTIVSKLGIGVDGSSRVYLTVNATLAQYSPDEVLNALHYFVVTQGALIAAGALFANTTEGFAIQSGGFLISSPNFYSKVSDTVTSGGNLGITVPLYAQVADSVYVLMPTYTVAVSNTSGVVLSYAPRTKATAAISSQDKADIRNGLATESNVNTVKSNLSIVNGGVQKASNLIPYTDVI